MDNKQKAFQQKVKNRKFAIDNSWRGAAQEQGNAGPGNMYNIAGRDQYLWRNLEDNLYEADLHKFNNGDFPLSSNKKYIGRFLVFLKRVFRKLLKIFFGWYLFPIYHHQNNFNGKLLNVVSIERDLLMKMEKRLAELENSNKQLLLELDVVKSVVGDKFDQLKDTVAELDTKLVKIENLPTADDEFYHHFEEKFRGSREDIVSRLMVYVPYIKEHLEDWSKARFVDIGSGRGEWLDILRYYGATDYVGVDLNARQNAIAEEHGHKTLCRDCIEYLAERPDGSVDLISGIQIIEHLCMSDLMELLKQCHRVLKKGGMILFETPNPRNLCVAAYTFYMDPSHKRPLDPGVVSFLAEWAGFADVKCLDENSHPLWEGIPLPAADDKDYELVKQFNDIKWLLYGPMDYALFAVKE